MIPGVTVEMGGKEWTVPPLTLGQLRRLLPKVRALTSIRTTTEDGDVTTMTMVEDHLDTIIDIVSSALMRNYPEATPEVVAELLDMNNAMPVMQTVLQGAGLKPGEARAVGNGATYMASSPPPADTVTQ